MPKTHTQTTEYRTELLKSSADWQRRSTTDQPGFVAPVDLLNLKLA